MTVRVRVRQESLITGNLTLKYVGTLTKCPHTAGGRSRRGSPKAGTTVIIIFDTVFLLLNLTTPELGVFPKNG